MLAAAGAGVGVVVVGVVGQTLTPLEPLGLLAPRQPSRGPLGLPVNKTAEEAQVPALAADWRLEVTGPQPYALSLAEVEALPTVEEELPFAANEGWGADRPLARSPAARPGAAGRRHGVVGGPGVLAGAARALQQVARRG